MIASSFQPVRRRFMRRSPYLLLAAGLLAAGLATAQVVRLDGSSTVYPISEAVAEEYHKANRETARVTVGISGTGGGFKKLCRGEIDIAGASRPILKPEMEACARAGVRYFELPVAFDAITVVVNPRNPLTQITVAELKAIWAPAAQGRVTRWRQVNPAWGDVPLTLYGPGTDSGTFDYFTEAVVGKVKSSRGDFTASEDDNVLVHGVQHDVGALAYFGYAYYVGNRDRLKAVAVVDPQSGTAVTPTEQSVMDGSYRPLARPIFIYVGADAYRKAEVRAFVDFYLRHAAELAREVRYIPLPPRAYELDALHLARGKVGTMFGGAPAFGTRIEELLAREARF